MFFKAVYELKQSTHLWFYTFTDKIKELVFFLSYYNHVFYSNYKSTYIVVYVNDLQIVGPDLKLIEKLKANFAS